MVGVDNLVKVTLDKERHLRLTLRGMLAFEKITGQNLLKGFNLKHLALKDSAALLWACLLHEDKELKFDDVLDMIDMTNLASVMESVTECLNQSLPKAEAGATPLAKTP